MSDRTNVCSTDSVGICFAHGHNAGLVCANDYSSSPGNLSAAGVDDSFKSVAAQKRIKKIAVHNALIFKFPVIQHDFCASSASNNVDYLVNRHFITTHNKLSSDN